MDFHIIKIEPKNLASGRGKIIRFGLSFYEEDQEPFLDIHGYLLYPDGKISPPMTYQQRGSRTTVVVHSQEFQEALEKEWRTHPELKEYSEMIAPDVAALREMPLKDRVKISLKGLRDEV